MENCIFCKIINQEIPSYKIYEDDKVYAFLDISQATKGHTLVVPKRHVADIFEYDPDRELAYQSVFHSHIHLVPRYSKEDDFSIHFVNHQDSYGSEELKAIQETIVKQVSCDD